MMKRMIGIAVFGALAASAFAGDTFELNGITGKDIPWTAAFAPADFGLGAGGINAAPAGVEAPRTSAPAPDKGWFFDSGPKPQSTKEWTVLVYVNGKNDLEAAGLYNLNKMELAGSNDSLNVVAEAGRMNGQNNDVDLDGDWTGSRRYYIKRDLNEKKVKSKVIESFDKVDMGDWKHLVDFAKWGMKNYPARHYALIVWNHGTGWVTSKGAYAHKGVSYDFETKNHLSTPELGAAMREIGKVDILAYDACLMQMAELLYEVKDYADYVVGSEETVPGRGFPYDTLLAAFDGSRNSEALASEMVRAYDNFYAYKDKDTNITLSAIRISALPEFMAAFNAWTDALIATDKKPQIKFKISLAAAYDEKDNKDLYDFARLAAEADPQGPVAEKSRALLEALDGKLIIKNTAYKGYGPDVASHGLAIYLPARGYNEKYDQLAWARDTRWDDFLKEMKDVSTLPGQCVKPGPDASLEEVLAYVHCLVP